MGYLESAIKSRYQAGKLSRQRISARGKSATKMRTKRPRAQLVVCEVDGLSPF